MKGGLLMSALTTGRSPDLSAKAIAVGEKIYTIENVKAYVKIYIN